MSKIEEMERYIKLTGVKYRLGTPYQMKLDEFFCLMDMAQVDTKRALDLAFKYGRAMGERHTRKELKKACMNCMFSATPTSGRYAASQWMVNHDG